MSHFDDIGDARKQGAKDASSGSDRSPPWPYFGESDEHHEARVDAYDEGFFNTKGQIDGSHHSWTKSHPTSLWDSRGDGLRSRVYDNAYSKSFRHTPYGGVSGDDINAAPSDAGSIENPDGDEPYSGSSREEFYPPSASSSRSSAATSSGGGGGALIILGILFAIAIASGNSSSVSGEDKTVSKKVASAKKASLYSLPVQKKKSFFDRFEFSCRSSVEAFGAIALSSTLILFCGLICFFGEFNPSYDNIYVRSTSFIICIAPPVWWILGVFASYRFEKSLRNRSGLMSSSFDDDTLLSYRRRIRDQQKKVIPFSDIIGWATAPLLLLGIMAFLLYSGEIQVPFLSFRIF